MCQKKCVASVEVIHEVVTRTILCP